MPIVCDASALVEVGLRSRRGRGVLDAIRGNDAVSPDLVNSEVLSAFRRLVQAGSLSDHRAGQAIDLLATMDLRRVGSTTLIGRIWGWRHNLSAYDATYVALAEALRCPLVTADERWTRVPGLDVPITVV